MAMLVIYENDIKSTLCTSILYIKVYINKYMAKREGSAYPIGKQV